MITGGRSEGRGIGGRERKGKVEGLTPQSCKANAFKKTKKKSCKAMDAALPLHVTWFKAGLSNILYAPLALHPI